VALWRQINWQEKQWLQPAGVSLSGSIHASSQTTSSLTKLFFLQAAVAAIAACSATVSAEKRIVVSVSADSAVSANARLSASVSSSVSANSSVTGSLSALLLFDSQVSAVSSVTSSAQAEKPLAVSTHGQSNLSAFLVKEKEFFGVTHVQSAVAGSLTAQLKLDGNADGLSNVVASLKTTKALSANIAANSSATSSLSSNQSLLGLTSGESSTSASVDVVLSLAALLTGDSQVAAALPVQKAVASSVDAQASLLATLSESSPLQGAIDGQSTVNGALVVSVVAYSAAQDFKYIATNWTDILSCAAPLHDNLSVPVVLLDALSEAPCFEDAEAYETIFADIATLATEAKIMTCFNSNLKDIVRGDNRRIERTFTGIPTGYVIEKAWLTVKATTAATDAQAVFQKVITTAAMADGQITTANSAGGEFAMYFELSQANTLAPTAWQEYYYDIQVKVSSPQSEIHTLALGVVKFIEQVTIATT
jgi:hypothetical protein